MRSDCNHKNPLQRSGVNQYKRVLQALLPAHARLDERDYADLILFAKNYASQIKYFNSVNAEDGDWQALMSMDVSVTLASFVKLDVPGCYSYVKNIFDTIRETDVSDTIALQTHFKTLFDFGFSITNLLNEYHKVLLSYDEFRAVLAIEIQSQLQQYYYRLRQYYDEAVSQGIIDATAVLSAHQPPIPIINSQSFNAGELNTIWFDSSLPIFTPNFNGVSISFKIKNTSTHNLFTGIFDQYLKAVARIVEQAGKYLETTLSNFPGHTPHYGLYLTFIKLFRYVQEHANNFSKRHLDLYYKEILQLKNRESEPDQVHLTFELSKAVENHLVKKNTVFKGGKDVDGEEIYYALTEDVVLNKGVVKNLKSAFVKRDINKGTLQLLANPVANSQDGLGGNLVSADKSWRIFGDEESTSATVGFVVASNYLFLNEGTRTIVFSFYAPPGNPITFNSADLANCFQLQLSGKKGWVDVIIDNSKAVVHSSKEYFSLTVTLDGGEQAIVPYSSKVHQHNFTTSFPVAKFQLKNAQAKESIWDLSIEKIQIDISVTGLRDVAIQNDTGNLSTSKPFDLFGSTPHIGSSFIVGSKEVFMKTLQPLGNVKVSLNLAWDDYADLTSKITSDDKHKVDIYHLEDSVWKTTQSNVKLFEDGKPDHGSSIPVDIFSPGGTFSTAMSMSTMDAGPSLSAESAVMESASSYYTFNFLNGISKLAVDIPQLDGSVDYTPNDNYSVKSTWGFFKIELNTNFGHGSYAQKLADAAISARIISEVNAENSNQTTTTIDIEEVEEPYTPKVKEISIDYSATTVIDFSSGDEGAYIHLTPFGSKNLTAITHRTLLPDINNKGEFFIGIENFKTEQTLSLLFQVAEGSADPLSVKQKLTWFLLSLNNEWVEFNKEDIADATNDLSQSGIIRFNISDKATSINTLMSDQLHWLRATVKEKTKAVCKLIAVAAQASKAQRSDYKKTGSYFKNTLPASTISKMVVSDAAIKKINQPFSSFGGKKKEGDEHFCVRVSERLRHKNRAIAVWDYEHMVLEAYPEIYKVKCINHTVILEETPGVKTTYVDNELKPGHVLVVTVPDLQNKNAYDLLRPYTSLGLLTEIKKYLYKHVSPHVNLDVRNVKFEEIQLQFKIKFVTDDNDYYRKQLKEELEQFLAPWAFNPQTDIEFGGKISKSSLIDFIEERPYVDYLSCVKMYQIVEGVKSADLDEALATSARSVFVSVKASDELNAHKISFISDKCDC
jgi:hypothetical protein